MNSKENIDIIYKSPPSIRDRTYFQLQRMLEQMFTAYLRDFRDLHSVQKVIELLLQDITTVLSKMKSYLN